VKLAIHESKQGYLFHIILANKDGIDWVEPHSRNIKIRKMVWAEDVIPFGIELSLTFYGIRKKSKEEHTFRPPAVYDSHQLRLFGKNNWDQQERKEN
jgi:hypothetical protein